MLGAGLPYQGYAAGSILTSILAYVIVSELTPPSASRRRVVEAFFDRLSRPVVPPATSTTAPPSPFGIVGVATLGLGVALACIGLVNPQVSDRILCGTVGGALALLGVVLTLVSICRRPDRSSIDPGSDSAMQSSTEKTLE
jgi:hypothetical protein